MDPTVLATKQYATMHSSLDRICGVDVRLGVALQEQDPARPTDTHPTLPSQVSVKRLCRFVCSNFSSYVSFYITIWNYLQRLLNFL